MRKISEIQRDLATELKNFKKEGQGSEKREASKVKLKALQKELEDAQLAESIEKAQAGKKISEENKKKAKRFSFTKFVREAATGDLTGVEKEMSELAVEEAKVKGIKLKGVGIPAVVLQYNRAAQQIVGDPASGGNLVQEEPMVYVEALKKKLVLKSLGAKFLTGLVGNVPIVKGGSFTAAWYEEGETATTGKVNTDKHLMKPKRLSVCGSYSVDLLNQSSPEVDALVVDELVSAHAIGIETAAIDGDGVKEPMGVLNNPEVGVVVGGVDGAAPSHKNMVKMETEVAAKDADVEKMAYLVNAKGRGALKTTTKTANGEKFIMEGNEVNGYKVAASNVVPSDISKGTGTNLSAAVFGNWGDMIIGQWGGLDLVVDPYAKKKEAEIEVVLHAYHDVALRNDESFSVIKDMITD